MENEKLKMNKRGVSIRDSFIFVILGIAGMVIMFTFITLNASEAGVFVPEKFNYTLSNLTATGNSVDALADNMRNAANSVKEAQIGDFAIFGIKGILNVMLIPFNLIGYVLGAMGASFTIFSEYVPEQVFDYGKILVAIILVFAVIRFISQRGNDA